MGREKISGEPGKTAQKLPLARIPNNFRLWILALVVMVIVTISWSIHEAQKPFPGPPESFRLHTMALLKM
jgi:hypothetical protein